MRAFFRSTYRWSDPGRALAGEVVAGAERDGRPWLGGGDRGRPAGNAFVRQAKRALCSWMFSGWRSG